MAGKKSDLGPTGVNVAQAVQRIRGERGLTYAELSRQLKLLDRDIPPLGLRRIESYERRVDADDLVALAVALDVSPATLLMPAVADKTSAAQMTACNTERTADDVWSWLTATKPLSDELSDISESDQWVAFIHDAWPIWRVREVYQASFEEMQKGPAVQRRKPDGDD